MAKCVVNFDQVQRQEEDFQRRFGRVMQVNTNINHRGLKEDFEIYAEDGLIEPKRLLSTSSDTVVAQLVGAYDDADTGGAWGLRNYLSSRLRQLENIGSKVISKSTITALGQGLETDNMGVYDSVISKIRLPIAEQAAEAGVTEDELEAYFNREDLPASVEATIEAYMKSRFSPEEHSLFKNMRKIVKQIFPLTQRVDKLLFGNGTFAEVDEMADDMESNITSAASRWKQVYGKIPFASSIAQHINRVVSTDNILMKMGAAKGSSMFNSLWYAIVKAKRLVEIDNSRQAGVLMSLITNEKFRKITPWVTKTNWKNVEKHGVTFFDGTAEMTTAEVISAYMTLRQEDIRGRFVYTEDELIDMRAKGEKPRTIWLDEFKSGNMVKTEAGDGSRKARAYVVSEDTWSQIEKIATDPKYSEVISAIDGILAEQHPKVDDTLWLLSGQHLGEIPNYFPTYPHHKKMTTYERQQKMVEDLRYTKERKNGLKSLEIRDVFHVAHNYIEATNYYAHTAVPIHNANVLWAELKKRNVFDEDFKVGADQYEKWLDGVTDNKDYLNYTDSDKVINKVARSYYKGVLGWNIPVVAKQPLAALHAANYFRNPKYGREVLRAYTAALDPSSRLIKRMKEHNPAIAPYVDTLAADELGQKLTVGMSFSRGAVLTSGAFGEVERVARQGGDLYMGNAMELIRRFDLAGRAALFAASESWVQENYNLSESDGQRYWDAVAEIHNQAMEDTQQTWDFMHRSGLARNPNALFRGVMMFTTQLQKHFTLMDKSMTDAVLYGRTADFKALFANAVSIMIVQAVMVAAIDMGKDFLLGYEDDDDEDKFRTLAAKTFSNNLAMVPLLNIYSNDLTNAVFGTDEYTRPASVPMFDLANLVFQKTPAEVADGDWQGMFDLIWKDYSKFAGVPLTPLKQIDAALKNAE